MKKYIETKHLFNNNRLFVISQLHIHTWTNRRKKEEVNTNIRFTTLISDFITNTCVFNITIAVFKDMYIYCTLAPWGCLLAVSKHDEDLLWNSFRLVLNGRLRSSRQHGTQGYTSRAVLGTRQHLEFRRRSDQSHYMGRELCRSVGALTDDICSGQRYSGTSVNNITSFTESISLKEEVLTDLWSTQSKIYKSHRL